MFNERTQPCLTPFDFRIQQAENHREKATYKCITTIVNNRTRKQKRATYYRLFKHELAQNISQHLQR